LDPCVSAICGKTYEGCGYLYNWYTIGADSGRTIGGIVNITQGYVDERNQWVVPTESDFNTLIGYLDPSYNPGLGIQSTIVGGLLKLKCSAPLSVSNGLWSNNIGATNLYNFSVVPTGYRALSPLSDVNISFTSFIWTSTESSPSNAFIEVFASFNADIFKNVVSEKSGCSIRLVRPATMTEISLPDGTTSNDNPILPHYLGNGMTYITVKIGNQVWTAQNLIDENYNDSTPIPEVTDLTTWSGLTTGARCSYNNGSPLPAGMTISLCGIPM